MNFKLPIARINRESYAKCCTNSNIPFWKQMRWCSRVQLIKCIYMLVSITIVASLSFAYHITTGSCEFNTRAQVHFQLIPYISHTCTNAQSLPNEIRNVHNRGKCAPTSQLCRPVGSVFVCHAGRDPGSRDPTWCNCICSKVCLLAKCCKSTLCATTRRQRQKRRRLENHLSLTWKRRAYTAKPYKLYRCCASSTLAHTNIRKNTSACGTVRNFSDYQEVSCVHLHLFFECLHLYIHIYILYL